MTLILNQFAGVIQVNGNPEHSFDLPLPTYNPVPEDRDPEAPLPEVINVIPDAPTNLLGSPTGESAASASANTVEGAQSTSPTVDQAAVEAEALRVAEEAEKEAATKAAAKPAATSAAKSTK